VARYAAAAVALHGIALALFSVSKPLLERLPEAAAEALFWLLAVPALILTSPFTGLLWTLGLMNAPGWFAWPKPFGVAIAYGMWIAALLALAQVVQWSARRQ
jgi:hypothetical protein